MEIQKEGGPKMEIEKIARENFERWAKALLTKDPGVVAVFYADDCTFLPTMSPELLIGPEEARGYFEHFLMKSPEGEVRKEKIAPMGELFYKHTGMYDFEIENKDAGRSVVEARFTFIWRKESDETWKIFHHHSSEKPKKGK